MNNRFLGTFIVCRKYHSLARIISLEEIPQLYSKPKAGLSNAECSCFGDYKHVLVNRIYVQNTLDALSSIELDRNFQFRKDMLEV